MFDNHDDEAAYNAWAAEWAALSDTERRREIDLMDQHVAETERRERAEADVVVVSAPETELCTYIIGWPDHDPDNVERCGRFARYLVVNIRDLETGFCCPGCLTKPRHPGDEFFDMYGDVS